MALIYVHVILHFEKFDIRNFITFFLKFYPRNFITILPIKEFGSCNFIKFYYNFASWRLWSTQLNYNFFWRILSMQEFDLFISNFLQICFLEKLIHIRNFVIILLLEEINPYTQFCNNFAAWRNWYTQFCNNFAAWRNWSIYAISKHLVFFPFWIKPFSKSWGFWFIFHHINIRTNIIMSIWLQKWQKTLFNYKK